MKERTKTEKLEYVADMAEQLSRLCIEEAPVVAELLRLAATFARDREAPQR